MIPERVHYALIRHVIERGHAPDLEELAERLECTTTEAAVGLRRLADMHGVILEPDSLRVWSVHPFAMMPTAFWVSAGSQGWWANCAWCALGIGAAMQQPMMIWTRDGGEGEPLAFTPADRPDLLVHFPYPPGEWWSNPYSPCANILFFTSQERIERWCERHGRPRGAALELATAVALARDWFGDSASPGWKRKTPAEAAAIFARLGLKPPFWRIPEAFR